MQNHRGGPARLGLLILAAMILFACNAPNSPRESGGEAQPTGSPNRGSPQEVILHFGQDLDLVDADFAAIEAAIDDDLGAARGEALEHLDEADVAARFAALYVLARTAEPGESQEALRPFLESPDVTERLLAAQALLVRGEKAAFPVLIDLLDSQEAIAYWDPPQQAWEAASFTLFQYTDEDLGLIGAEEYASTAAAKPAWGAWWEQNQDALLWDESAGVYRGGGQ